MPELRSLTRPKIVSIVVDLGDGDEVTIGFDRNKVTPDWVVEAQRRDSEKDTLSLPKALADVITEWDVTDDGAPFPPTAENLSVLNYFAQATLLRMIMKASVPGEAEGKASPERTSIPLSVSTAPPQTSQNGTEPSVSPGPSTSQSPT